MHLRLDAPRTRRRTAAPRGPSRALCALALVAAVLAADAGAAPRREPAREPVLQRAERTRVLMGAPCVAVAEGHDSVAVGRALEEALDAIELAAAAAWVGDSASELSRLNAAGAETQVTCTPELWAMVAHAFELARETDGAFDPSIEPLVRAWDVRGAGRRPDPSTWRAAREATGWLRVQVDPGARTVRFPRPDMGLDLTAIVAGHGLERAVERLRGRGVRRALLTLDGHVEAFADVGTAWSVPVGHPDDRLRPAVWLAVRRGAIATTSLADPTILAGGLRMGRVLDVLSGTPVPGEASVTVVTRSGARAGALATALLVMGRERAERFVAARRDLGVLWLEPDGSTLRAWRWNLPAATADPRAVVRWEP